MTFLVQTMIIMLFAPLVAFPVIVIITLAMGAIHPTGLWRDSFDTTQLSPARITQSIFALAAAAVLSGLGQNDGTAFEQ